MSSSLLPHLTQLRLLLKKEPQFLTEDDEKRLEKSISVFDRIIENLIRRCHQLQSQKNEEYQNAKLFLKNGDREGMFLLIFLIN